MNTFLFSFKSSTAHFYFVLEKISEAAIDARNIFDNCKIVFLLVSMKTGVFIVLCQWNLYQVVLVRMHCNCFNK